MYYKFGWLILEQGNQWSTSQTRGEAGSAWMPFLYLYFLTLMRSYFLISRTRSVQGEPSIWQVRVIKRFCLFAECSLFDYWHPSSVLVKLQGLCLAVPAIISNLKIFLWMCNEFRSKTSRLVWVLTIIDTSSLCVISLWSISANINTQMIPL